MGYNRRNFLKISGVGITGVFVAGNVNADNTKLNYKTGKSDRKIIYRTLGKTGLKLPVVSMGAMKSDNPKLLEAALKGGIIHFDTAQSYQEGRNEEMVGDFMKQYQRESFIVATKIGLRQQNLTKEEFFAKVDVSLQRLKTNYIDILYLHGVRSREVALDPNLLSILVELKKSGKVKFVGVSTHTNMAEVIRAAVEAQIYDVILTSYNFKLENVTDLTQAIAEAAKAGLGIIAMKTMAGVYWDKEKTKKINTKAALKWALQNPNIHTTIPGFTSFDQLEECLSVIDNIELTEQELLDLKGDGSMTGLFCRGCEHCLVQCPHNMPVPDIMRSYMYAYGYHDLKLARGVIDDLANDIKVDCKNCTDCKVTCQQGFDVQARAIDILRVRDIPVDLLA
jgi:predicted aldo/keto reductase-like oxidoreductase